MVGRDSGRGTVMSSRSRWVPLGLLILLASGVVAHGYLCPHNANPNEDIYCFWVEGKRILSGENPYERTLSGNMRYNDRYPTHLPLFYLLSSLTQLAGFTEYPHWIFVWRQVFLAFNLGIAAALFYHFYRRGLTTLGFFSAAFWLFSRWTLHVTKIGQLDFIPIFLLLLSLMLFRDCKWRSLLLFGLSLAVKQMAIFLVPLYLIWSWKSAEQKRPRHVLTAALVIASIPLAVSIPFIVWNAEGFLRSIAFSATRDPATHLSALSFDVYISRVLPEFAGIVSRAPMVALMGLIYISAYRWNLGVHTGALLVMTVFVDFNPVLFPQYMCWVVPLLPLAVCDGILTCHSVPAEQR